MSNPSEYFECQWQLSRCLLAAYLILLCLAWIALWLAAIPWWASLTGTLLCGVHAGWVLPGHVLLRSKSSFVGLRHSAEGWQLLRVDGQWQTVQLCRDSLALPMAVVLRFRLPEGRRVRGVCILPDAMDGNAHRRLRVRLKFSRNRWVAAE